MWRSLKLCTFEERKKDEVSKSQNPSAAPVGGTGTHEPRLNFKNNKEEIDTFIDLLETIVPSKVSWKQAVRLITSDPRYSQQECLNEEKQAFNACKNQCLKEEKEGERIRAKKAREDLQEFLMSNDKMTSITRYYQCQEMFGEMDVWKNVAEPERRDVYDDCVFKLSKQEEAEAEALKKRNMSELASIFDTMIGIEYDTTWQEAQQMLMKNPNYTDDAQLLEMDKEDALLVFEDHILELEKDEEKDKEVEERRMKRLQRRNREDFVMLLDELHKKGKLTSESRWVELFSIITADFRYSAMLEQPGSTPLDLFKFYVQDLKSRFHD